MSSLEAGTEVEEPILVTRRLLYSCGLQDQEFVGADDLRDTEASRYTKGDTPLHTGVLISAAEWAESLA